MKRQAEEEPQASPRVPGSSPRPAVPGFKAGIPLPGHPLFPKVPPRLGGLLLPDVSALGLGGFVFGNGDKLGAAVATPPWKVARSSEASEQPKVPFSAASPPEPSVKAMSEVPSKAPSMVAPRPQAPPWRAAPERPAQPGGNVAPAAAPASTGSGASFSKAAAAASSGMVPNPNDLLRRGEELLRQTAQLHQQNEMAQKKQEEDRKKQEEMERRRAEVEEKRRVEEERRRLIEEEQQNVRRQADEAAQVLQDELRKLIEVAELETQMAEAESAKIDQATSCEEIVRVSEDFETATLSAQHAVKACFDFMDGRHLKLKGNTEAWAAEAKG
eukprot:symbB.v1.2.023715.t1/scaffold2193.1/size86202/1